MNREVLLGSHDAIMVMGVSGSGKSTLARNLAEHLGYRFIEGDDFHSPECVAKMAAGVPLDDTDREPWLSRLAEELRFSCRNGGAVLACSALKRRYRDHIRTILTVPLTVVEPQLSHAVLAARLSQRRDHYMPASLLESQLQAREAPGDDERAICVDGTLSTAAQVSVVLAAIQQR